MFQKALHTGNIAASIAVAATAADLTFAGGAVTTIAVALSSLEIFKKSDTPTKELTKQTAASMQAAFDSSSHSEGQLKHVAQMLDQFEVTENDLAKGNLDATRIAANMRAKIKSSALDPAHKTDATLNAYVNILEATLGPVLDAPVGIDPLQFAVLREMLVRSETSEKADLMRDEGITEKAIIRLAQRIAEDTQDVGQAWLELQNAMDMAVRVQKEGQMQSNHGDFVDTVLARVAELAKNGEYKTAGAEIATALSRAEAQIDRLLSSGIEVALLDRDTATAAKLIVRKADADAGGRETYKNLEALQDHFHVLGRDKGSVLNSLLAIDLSRLLVDRATSPPEEASASNNLGVSLHVQGERDQSDNRLKEAILALEYALSLKDREKDPLSWATTKMNLGVTFVRLGERAQENELIEEAISAFEDALEEYTEDRDPLNRASIKMNLGAAFQTIGERGRDIEKIKSAIAAYADAIRQFDTEETPLQWARANGNMGNAQKNLGEFEANIEHIETAVNYFEKALGRCSETEFPLDWARLQMSLGNVLVRLGEVEDGHENLRLASEAYGKANKIRTREKMPMQWALTQGNLAGVEFEYFRKTGDKAHLDRAADYVNAARDVFLDAKASQYISMADSQLSLIERMRLTQA